MATAEGTFPKIGNDPIYASEINNTITSSGDGSDGAFNETSGTTNLTQGTIYQYTSFLLDTSATLSATSTSDKPIIILVQGNATISGTIDLKGKGFAAKAGYNSGHTSSTSSLKTIGAYGGQGGDAPVVGIGGGKLLFSNYNLNKLSTMITNGTGGGDGSAPGTSRGGGGGGGASSSNDGENGLGATASPGGGTGGTGSAGGCTLYMIVGGDLTLNASASIDTSGNPGGAATGDGGGGGGGGSGDIIILYGNTLTDNSPTLTTSGGAGGTAGVNTGGAGGAGSNFIYKILNNRVVN